MPFVRLVSTLLALVLWATCAFAGPPKLAAQAEAYVAKNNLKVREFKRDIGTRVVHRMFVPVLPTTVDSFVEHFSLGHNAAVWRATPGDLVHGVVNLGPKQGIAYGNTTNQLMTDQTARLSPNGGGHYVTFSLSEPQLDHWKGLMLKYAANTQLYNGRNTYKTPDGKCHGSCMWWVVHGEIAPELNLAQHLGVQRAKGPEVLFNRAIHSGGDHVGPIGIAVKTLAEFEAMTEAQLFGPEPAGGAAARAKLLPGEVIEKLAPAPNAAAGGPQKLGAADAAKLMGKHVFMATGSAMPSTIAQAMHTEALKRQGRTNVYYMSTFSPADHFKPDVTDKWHPNLFFISEQNREAAMKGHATLHRNSLYSLSQQIKAGQHPIDTVAVRVSPPDAEGMVSIGTSSDLTMNAIEEAIKRGGKIIAEVNPNVPHVHGNRIPFNKLSAVVEANTMLPEPGKMRAPISAERALAGHVATLVPEGATLQVGIGGALGGIGEALKTRKNLRVWSELGADWLRPLMDGPNAPVKQATVSFLHGSNDLYKLANNNKAIHLATTYEVNNPATIAAQPHMRSINTALEVDLTGNVNAERIGDRILSFPGGQPDFMKGAAESPNGRAIMALRSLTKNGGSTVVLKLNGPLITTPKQHVDHVVTEWGATPQLRGMNDAQRMVAMIAVAHPIHRAELAAQLLAAGHINQAQHDQIVAGIKVALANAPLEFRRHAANLALDKKILTAEEHARIVANTPEVEPGL